MSGTGAVIGKNIVDTVVTRTNVMTLTSVQSAVSNVVIRTLTTVGSVATMRDETTTATLPAITVGTLGATTASIASSATTAGASVSMSLTINKLTNALAAGDKIVFSLPSTWTSDYVTASTCTVTKVGTAVAITSSTANALTNRMTIIVNGVARNDVANTVVACGNIQTTVHVEAAMSILVAYTTTGADERKEYTASVTLPSITFGAVGTTMGRWCRRSQSLS